MRRARHGLRYLVCSKCSNTIRTISISSNTHFSMGRNTHAGISKHGIGNGWIAVFMLEVEVVCMYYQSKATSKMSFP